MDWWDIFNNKRRLESKEKQGMVHRRKFKTNQITFITLIFFQTFNIPQLQGWTLSISVGSLFQVFIFFSSSLLTPYLTFPLRCRHKDPFFCYSLPGDSLSHPFFYQHDVKTVGDIPMLLAVGGEFSHAYGLASETPLFNFGLTCLLVGKGKNLPFFFFCLLSCYLLMFFLFFHFFFFFKFLFLFLFFFFSDGYFLSTGVLKDTDINVIQVHDEITISNEQCATKVFFLSYFFSFLFFTSFPVWGLDGCWGDKWTYL